MTEPLGFSGRLARRFLTSELTPLLALAALLLGVFAVLVTPREEEPQINVTMANVIIPFPGASAAQVESLVAVPMEKVLAEIAGVKHIYSVSRPSVAVVTVQFEVGQERTDAIVRLYNAIYSNQDWRPAGLGVLQPLVKPKGIDDVPILSLTLWTKDTARGANDLAKVARALEPEIQRVPGTRNVYTVGAPDDTVSVVLDPQRLAGHGLSVSDLSASLTAANVVRQAGSLVSGGRDVPVQAGEFLADRDQVAGLVVAVRDGRPVYLEDVAEVRSGPAQPRQYVTFGAGPAAAGRGVAAEGTSPAVTIAVSKKPGQNAIDVSRAVIERLAMLKGTYVPDGVEVTVTRDYGVTANDKAQKLIQKLAFATASVVLLVWLTVGWREAVVVGAAVVVTLAATLFASWAWGFTINRVSLFALIFAIGILVDDAIVIVENIHRHLGFGGTAREVIPRAVDEVGGPTILATFTVIAALLPMAFVSGLMGPYMSPIPINASMGMLISLAIALVVTPWMSERLLGHAPSHDADGGGSVGRLGRFFERVMGPFVRGEGARRQRHRLYLGTLAAIAIAVSMVALEWVVMKMLPFDNKSEFQVVVDLPVGSALEEATRVLDELAAEVAKVPEVTDYQVYAGTAAPINFNGLVRQYYLRSGPEQGDIQVNLVDKHHRDRSSHEIAVAIRPALAAIGRRHGAAVKVVEVPPGPPVQAPLVAEVYAPFEAGRAALARAVRKAFDAQSDIVDVDDSLESPAPHLVVSIDRQKAALLGVEQSAAVQVLAAGLGGEDATYVRVGRETTPIPVRLELAPADQARIGDVLALRVRSRDGGLVPLSEIATVEERPRDTSIYHKDLLPLAWVSGDAVGSTDSPLYGMFEVVGALKHPPAGAVAPEQRFFGPPVDPNVPTVKWDGEWQITYETFRDMGLAYSVGLLLIYLLVVAQFKSYAVPLVIMAPIPLTIIGVMPGHALLGAQFTATSMIGMIALAGIIVRNSILLVDFVNVEVERGRSLADAVISAATVRARPIALTAVAAMTGAFFILDDPIFNGLAVSLIFGILVSTALTLVLIPILYFSYRSRKSAA
ncbi:MAG: efflux RND transporter permease subunit [Steroidobacteraceae bacterium]